MDTHELNPTVQRILLWTGPALVAVLVIALIPLAHLIPPPSPADSREQIAAFFAAHTTGIRVGCVLMMIFFTFFATWSAVLIAWIRRIETGFPVITCALIALAVFTDRNDPPIFARWVGYYNAWEAVFLCPFLLIEFFKTGPFAWDGLIGFYLPTAGFCIWLGVMTVVLLRAIRDAERASAVRLPAKQRAIT